MFVVAAGTVFLKFEESLRDKAIGEREFFGELALFIGSHCRLADAFAQTDCVLYEVDREAFDTVLVCAPAAIADFIRHSSFAYLVDSEQQLITSLKRRNEDLLCTLHALRQARSELDSVTQLVHTDELTGLCNRRGLYAYLETLEGERRDAASAVDRPYFGLILIDLDHFKRINDRCGHLAGDAALRAVAGVIRSLAGPGDLPCRLGGDEFALLLGRADADALDQQARRIVEAVRTLPLVLGQDVRLSVSVGACACPAGESWSDWYGRADAQLYRAKFDGGDRWNP